jgi:preprotein translocase subunit SecE
MDRSVYSPKINALALFGATATEIQVVIWPNASERIMAFRGSGKPDGRVA